MPVRIVISGCCGKMGQAIGRSALADKTFAIGAVLEGDGHEAIGKDYGELLGDARARGNRILGDAREAINVGDVVIEFTTPEATMAHLQTAQQLRKPVVIGTTGFTESQRKMVQEASRVISVVMSPNMSLGVNLLFELARMAAERLGHSFDIEIVESHHRHKKDSPSGTAKRLAEVLGQARGATDSTIPVHAVRAGDVVGDHTVIFAGPAERLELTHRAHSRDVFALGALKAARFAIGQRPGLYDMSHVLGFGESSR